MSSNTPGRRQVIVPQLDAAASIYASVIPGRMAVYVAAPLTTGLAYADVNGSLIDRSVLLARNRSAAADVANHARLHFACPVIDPTTVAPFPGWTQRTYRHLWRRVIATRVHTIVFADGWEFSTGCTHEFIVALSLRLTLLDARLSPLLPSHALKLLTSAHISLRTLRRPRSAQKLALQTIARYAENGIDV